MELPPEVIVEAIFNPLPSKEEGPFTYVPETDNMLGLQSESAVISKILHDAAAEIALDRQSVRGSDEDGSQGAEDRKGGKGIEPQKKGWFRRKKEEREREREKEKAAMAA